MKAVTEKCFLILTMLLLLSIAPSFALDSGQTTTSPNQTQDPITSTTDINFELFQYNFNNPGLIPRSDNYLTNGQTRLLTNDEGVCKQVTYTCPGTLFFPFKHIGEQSNATAGNYNADCITVSECTSCGSSLNSCLGSATLLAGSESTSGANSLWTCTNTPSGTDESCSIAAPYVWVLTNGSCNPEPGNAYEDAGSNVEGESCMQDQAVVWWDDNNCFKEFTCNGAVDPVGVCSSPIAFNSCDAGTVQNETTAGTNHNWDCVGTNNTPVSCTTPVPTCGSSNGGSYSSSPSSNLCITGTTNSSVTDAGATWTWTCSGATGTTAVDCSATKASMGDIIFVTSTTFAANAITQPSTADTICNGLAGSSPLSDQGMFRALLGYTLINPAERYSDSDPVYNTNGQQVFASTDAMWGGVPAVGINYDENGNLVTPSNVWTGSGNNGMSSAPFANCNDWLSTSIAGVGTVAWSATAASNWLSNGTIACDQTARLYCINSDLAGAPTYTWSRKPSDDFCHIGPGSPPLTIISATDPDGSSCTVEGALGKWSNGNTCGGGNEYQGYVCGTLAKAPITTACGSAHGSSCGGHPSGASACSAGSEENQAGSGPWTWTCSDGIPANDVNCSCSDGTIYEWVDTGDGLGENYCDVADNDPNDDGNTQPDCHFGYEYQCRNTSTGDPAPIVNCTSTIGDPATPAGYTPAYHPHSAIWANACNASPGTCFPAFEKDTLTACPAQPTACLSSL